MASSPRKATAPAPAPASASASASSSFSSSSASLSSLSPRAASRKRPAATLLPPFEPLSSSPVLPRPLKRQALCPSSSALDRPSSGSGLPAPPSRSAARLEYPTPIPTSSTGILSSSPPRRAPASFHGSRPEAVSALSVSAAASCSDNRAPLSSVRCVELSDAGEPVLMGRSSNSSHYQLSANRLISRVHVRVRYVPSSAPLTPARVEIICTGWNGLRVHSQGRGWDLQRGDTFTSETEGADIMMDVQDTRVMVRWPRRASEVVTILSSDCSPWDDSPRSAPPSAGALQASPLRRSFGGRLASPVSPSPVVMNAMSRRRSHALLPGGAGAGAADVVQIYEDESGDEAGNCGEGGQEDSRAGDDDDDGNDDDDDDDLDDDQDDSHGCSDALPTSTSIITNPTSPFSSGLSDDDDDDHEPDEENDPIVHSFGPFGHNISSRLASMAASSPRSPPARRRRLQSVSRDIHPLCRPSPTRRRSASPPPVTVSPPPPPAAAVPSPFPPASPASAIDPAAITNHVINQLAFSRLASTPLSTVLANLPDEQKLGSRPSHGALVDILKLVPCIGMIARQGKDAAGKVLENEYYYIPERDGDEHRRLAVVDGLGKPSLRSCRRQHKQYFWKRPRTP